MSLIAPLNHLIDLLLAPFHRLNPLPQLLILSLVSSVLLLVIFKKVSDQETIKRHKNAIFGNFLEIAIYRDQFRRSLRCQANVLKHNLLYLKALGLPFVLMLPPMLLVCLQLDYRLGYQPLKPGSSFLIEAQVAKGALYGQPDIVDTLILTPSETISIESPALRIAASGQVFWQARVTAAGSPNFIAFSLPGKGDTIRKELAVNTASGRFSPETNTMTSWQNMLASGENPLPQTSWLSSIRVSYPQAEYPLWRWRFSPIIYFFILTTLFGLALKPFLRVTL